MHTKKENSSAGEIILYGIGFLLIIVLVGSLVYYAITNRKKNNKKAAEKEEKKTKQCPIKYENTEKSVQKPVSNTESAENSERSEKSETPLASSEAPKKPSETVKNDASSLELVVPPEQARKPLSKEESKEKFDNSKEVIEQKKEHTIVDMEPKSHTGSKSKSTSKEDQTSLTPNQIQNAPVIVLNIPKPGEAHHSAEISSQRSEMSTFHLNRAGFTPPTSPLPSSEFSSTPTPKTGETLRTVAHQLSSETTVDVGTPTKPK
ncbi:unnamed protein product [Caenorhabditis angaria]|uniref:Uncharacterized protein n=1 Tax=Caenorhabditis angaria TaxID=860376 RepID=A0A9P1N574_9PELO|nr:unnamed protein product [Caenorhabditis angaria]